MFMASTGFILGVLFFRTFNNNNFSFPHPHSDYTKICFENEHSDFHLPVLRLIEKGDETRGMQTFYTWTQRVGYIPSLEFSLEEALRKGDLTIIINPIKGFTEMELNMVDDYMKQGGKVLVMDNYQNTSSVSNQLTERYGISIERSKILPNRDLFVLSDTEQDTVIIHNVEKICSVTGGEPLLASNTGDTVLTLCKKGKGVLAVFSGSNLFTTKIMGFDGTIPTPFQKEIYELEFFIIRFLVAKPKHL